MIERPRQVLCARLQTMLWVELTLADDVLPELLEGVRAVELRQGLERHLLETEQHAAMVRRVLDLLGEPPAPQESPALLGLKAEHDLLLADIDEDAATARDLVHAHAAAQTEHLEIAAYDALRALADACGEEEAGALLEELLEQEQHALELAERALAKLLAEKVESA